MNRSNSFPALWLLIATSALSCSPQTPPRPKVAVTVASVSLRDMAHEISASGTVEAWQSASVQAQVAGIIQRVAFKAGDQVQAGQVLFQIDSRPYHAELERLQGVLARDAAQARNAVAEARRADELFAKSLISQAEQEQKRSAAAALEATVRSDSGSLRAARINFENTTVRAPIPGRTGEVLIKEGNLVKSSDIGNPLVTINQTHPIRVRFTLPERDLPLVLRRRASGVPVHIHPQGDDSTSIPGTLSFVDNGVDPATGTILLKADVQNPGGMLWPGEFVGVSLIMSVSPNAQVVPAIAVNPGPSGTYVYVIGPDSVASLRPVKVSMTEGAWSVISDGLKPGEQVVTDGQLRLSPGARVVIKGADPGARPRP